MADEKLPWFKMYPQRFMGDENVQLMGPTELGVYMAMLLHQWKAGAVPDDPKMVARICRGGVDEVREAWKLVRPCFDDHPEREGYIIQARMEAEREAALNRREAARKAAKARSEAAERDEGGQFTSGEPAKEPADGPAAAGADGGASGPAKDPAMRASDASDVQKVRQQQEGTDKTERENNTPPSGEKDSRSLGNWTTEYVPIITDALWLGPDPPEKSPDDWTLAAELRAIKTWRGDGRRDEEIRAFLLGAAILRDREELGGVERDEGITCARLRYDSPYDVVDQWSRFPHAYYKFEGQRIGDYEVESIGENGRSGEPERVTA